MTENCWTEPTRCHDELGYMRVHSQTYGSGLGHRAVFLAVYGYLPEVVRHRCDNPPCYNPAHLLPGTHQDNMNDQMKRGRYPYATHCKNGHPLSDDNTTNDGRNRCLTCRRKRDREYQRMKRQRIKEGTW